ncbi:hypothetical protein KIN20_015717 [Parelaphostrongylus tenuis]|uniref:Uncharacterized protein n=1 Tax=Parelaphostrongylus tenuis TaxID=148309 RepID=A0AAD5MXQ9_PARTN|nr:hypothetical protein KIN20_015717 [Parelaphostrongylus tenuis]
MEMTSKDVETVMALFCYQGLINHAALHFTNALPRSHTVPVIDRFDSIDWELLRIGNTSTRMCSQADGMRHMSDASELVKHKIHSYQMNRGDGGNPERSTNYVITHSFSCSEMITQASVTI